MPPAISIGKHLPRTHANFVGGAAATVTFNQCSRSTGTRIEQTIGKLKPFKRVAMRCEKTDISYSAIISFACGLMLVESVHTA